ncbi:MAG: hypothetical protein IH840_04530 [Candidatus Heimdallarchaeota archaeon]|nr:hypothetical protein [Candidatus Heimdallarchaeota archaeon]
MITKPKIAAYAIGALIVLSAFGLLLSFKRVDATYYGLDKNDWTGQVDNKKVYDPGRYRLGILHSFILFSSIQQSIEFTVSSGNQIGGRTSDGLAISLDISFQYLISKSIVIELYNTFGLAYEDVINTQARDSIRDAASSFDAIQFFNNRTVIGAAMEVALRTIIQSVVGVSIPGFQLRAVDLPDAFENALERAEVARQEIQIAQFEQASALIRAQTTIFEAAAAANITLIEAAAEADAFLILINAQAEAVNITLAAQTEAYYALAQALNFTSAELLAFLWIQALTQIGEFGNLIIIGDNTPDIILSTNSTAF